MSAMDDATSDRPLALQRIARLTPLANVLARVDALVVPVGPREAAVVHFGRQVIADDLTIGPLPPAALALRDGWAVNSDATGDASAYAPVLLRTATRIDAGEPLPDGTDAVADLDAVTMRDGAAEAIAPVAPGEGVLPIGADVEPSALLVGGSLLTPIQAAVLAAAGRSSIRIRAPRVRILSAHRRADPIIDAAVAFIADAVLASGCAWAGQPDVGGDAHIESVLQDPAFDMLIAIGGTGAGRNDASVSTLARLGRVETHGIALSPGETTAFGFVGARPVLLLPGRLDAALAAWLLIGRRILARLSGAVERPDATPARLARKIASSLGMAELIPVRCRAGAAEPLASGYLPLQALAQADGWVLVPADSEGCPAGAEVMVRPWR